MKSFKQFHEAAITAGVGLAAKTLPTLLKVGGAYAAAKGGERLLKDLLGVPGSSGPTDWTKNPRDDTDREVNTRLNQVKDAAKNRPHDRDIEAYRKTIDPKTGKTTLSPEDQIKVIKNAAAKHPALKKVNKKLNKDKK